MSIPVVGSLLKTLRWNSYLSSNLLTETGSDVRGHIWTTVETTVGIVCACMPTLGPIFHRRCRVDSSYQSNTGPSRYTRFHNSRDLAAEGRSDHELQVFSSPPKTVVRSTVDSGFPSERQIQKTTVFDLTYSDPRESKG